MSEPTANDDSTEIRPRKPLVAFLLSACPGLGQHYAGHLGRGILFYIALIVASWLAAIAFMSIASKLSIVFLCVPFAGAGLIALDAWNCARKQPQDYRLQWFNRVWLYGGVFLTLLLTVNPLMDALVGRHIVRAYFMGSSSMTPAILERDILLINKLAFPQRGEIALVRFGHGEASAKLTSLIDDQLIRRIIAVPGDLLEIRNDEVWLNGRKLEEPYAHHGGTLFYRSGQSADFGPERVPRDAYFVMGDSRNESIDSRILGYIRKDQIGGTVTKVFWSWNFEDGSIRWNRTAMSLK